MQERLVEIEDILLQLTTEEKVKLLNGASTFQSVPIERLGIPAIQYLDGGTGINWEQLIGDWASTDAGTAREVLRHFDEPDQLVPEYQEVFAEIGREGLPRRATGLLSSRNLDGSHLESAGGV